MVSLFGSGSGVLGLDIGFETLKLCQIAKRTSTGVDLWGAIEYPITEPILDRDRIRDKAAAATIIKEACRKATPHAINASKIVTALPETFVFSKTIQVPKMASQELALAVPNEAAQYLPIPIEDVYVDFQVLITHPDEPLIDVLVAASPKRLVDDYVEMVKLANMELVALETKPIATGRAIIRDKNSSVAIVHIGSELTRIAIWDKANIILVTTSPNGKNQIIESISGIHPEIQQIKDFSKKIDDTTAAMAFDSIIDEVLDAIRYHQNRGYKPVPVSEIKICGSVANIPGIDEYFYKQTKIKSSVFAPRLLNKKTMEPQMIPSLGLAMRKI